MTTARPDSNALVDDFSDPLFRFFRSHGIAYAEAQDLAHDVFVVFYEKDLTAIENHKAFLWGIARNKLRQAKTRPRNYEEYRTGLGPDVLTSLSELVDRNLRVQALLMQLEDDERTIFLLRCEGLTVDEISRITGSNTSMINRRLAATRSTIDRLGQDAGVDALGADDVADHYRKM